MADAGRALLRFADQLAEAVLRRETSALETSPAATRALMQSLGQAAADGAHALAKLRAADAVSAAVGQVVAQARDPDGRTYGGRLRNLGMRAPPTRRAAIMVRNLVDLAPVVVVFRVMAFSISRP